MIRFALTMTMVLSALPAAAADAADQKMLELADKSRCLNCHDVKVKVTGPAWRDVAARYRGKADVFETLVKKVREGGSGNWGTEAMSANKRVKEEDIRALVAWILALD